MKIVIHPPIDEERLALLETAAPEARFVNALTGDDALAAMPEADAFLGKITPELLGQAKQLKWVQAFTASLEHYMFPALLEHPCVLTNTRGLFGDVIADQVMGYILCFARNLHHYIRQQLERRYEPAGGEAARVDNAMGPGTVNAMDRATIFLPGSKLGLVGFGSIGQGIAQRAAAFGMRIRAVDRFPDRLLVPSHVEAIWGSGCLRDLLAWSDFAVIAAPETPETQALFNRNTLELMKPGSYLINVGRGAIVVLQDLVKALRDGPIAGAALDVFEVEPLPPDHPLWDCPNVIITPHTGGYSTVVAERHQATLFENVRRFSRGESLQNVVDKRLWF